MTINKISFGLSLFFYWLMLVMPTSYQAERGALLAFLVMIAIIHLLRSKNWRAVWRLDLKVAIVGFVCVLASVFFMFYGALHDTPGALSVGTVYVVWPLLFLFFMGVFHNPEDWVPFLKVLIIGSICAAMVAVLAVMEAFGIFNIGLLSMLGERSHVFIGETLIGFSMPNLSTALFAVPYFCGLLLLPREVAKLNGIWSFCVWLGLLLTIGILVLSSRRAFWVAAALAPLIFMLLSMFCHVKINWKKFSILATTIFVVVVIVIFYVGINLEASWIDFLEGFEFDDINNEDAYVRTMQFKALLHGWIESPFFGAGHGGGAREYIRAAEVPYEYELGYMSLLFHTGLVGVSIYGGAVCWLFVKSARIVRRHPEAAGMLIPLLTGLMCFLIANTTNPYLEKFDLLWTLFLPIAVLNAYSLNNNKWVLKSK